MAALAFAQAFRELAPDLALIGVQIPQDLFGQTAPLLAAELGWPQASVVGGVSATAERPPAPGDGRSRYRVGARWVTCSYT